MSVVDFVAGSSTNIVWSLRGGSPLRTSLLRCVPVLNAGITFLDGSGVGTKYFCQPQERCDVIFGPFSLQDLELLDFSYTHGKDQGNLGAIEALGDMLPPLNRTQFSCYPGCSFVHLFLRHSGYHGAQMHSGGLLWPDGYQLDLGVPLSIRPC